MYIYVYIYVYIYIYTYVYIYVCVYIYIYRSPTHQKRQDTQDLRHMYIYTHTHTCINTCVYVYMNAYIQRQHLLTTERAFVRDLLITVYQTHLIDCHNIWRQAAVHTPAVCIVCMCVCVYIYIYIYIYIYMSVCPDKHPCTHLQ
jgi:hypothetical protein